MTLLFISANSAGLLKPVNFASVFRPETFPARALCVYDCHQQAEEDKDLVAVSNDVVKRTHAALAAPRGIRAQCVIKGFRKMLDLDEEHEHECSAQDVKLFILSGRKTQNQIDVVE